jgi:hypothetical protein
MRRQRSTNLTALAFGVATVGLLAGCSSSSTSATTTTTTTGSPATTSLLPTGGTVSATQGVTKLESSLSGGNALTYKATYALVTPSLSGTLVIERMPPSSSRFEMAVSGKQVAVISTPAATYVCDLTTPPGTCLNGQTNPFAQLQKLADPTTILSHIRQAAASGTQGVTFNTQTVAGVPSTCAVIPTGQKGSFCVTDQGILASATAGDGTLTLTAYSAPAPAADFVPPTGSTT